MTAHEIANRLGRTEDAVWLRALRLGLDKREETRPWTEGELDDLRANYAVEPPARLAERLGRTASAVYQQARCLDLASGKTAIVLSTNHDYFHAVYGAEQAYILGLLAADGNVADAQPRIAFGLQAKDADLVGFVRDRLCPKAHLSRSSRDGFVSLQVTSRNMVGDLSRFGVVPRKSRILGWPAQLGHLLRPFLLGYFDGDGTAYLVRDKYPGWSVCSGSEAFLVDLKKYVQVEVGLTMEKIHHRPNSSLYQVATTGRGAFLLDEWLHQHGLGLARKRFPERVLIRYRSVDGRGDRAPTAGER
jgi:hypothetical protein